MYEIRRLGITDRSVIMKLRMECIFYGGISLNREMSRRTFQIAEEILSFLIETDFKISEIASLLSTIESTSKHMVRI